MTYRLYFHKRNGNDPVIWSVDEGTQGSEIHVQGFLLLHLNVTSGRNLEAKDGEPSGWMVIQNAHMRIEDGIAIFTSAV